MPFKPNEKNKCVKGNIPKHLGRVGTHCIYYF